MISIPAGTVKANPFLPYRDISGSSVSDVPKYDLVAPPEVLNENSDVRTPELDFHEMILSYGIVYGICLLVFPIFLTLKAILFFLWNKTFPAFIIAMISGALLLHGILAGHVFFVFTICGLWFPLYAYLDNRTNFAEENLKQCES